MSNSNDYYQGEISDDEPCVWKNYSKDLMMKEARKTKKLIQSHVLSDDDEPITKNKNATCHFHVNR